MTDNTQPEAREFTMSQYASKDDMIGAMRKRIAELESELEAVGAGGVQALSAAPAGFVPVAAFARLHAHAESLAARLLAASPTPPTEQQAAPKAAPVTQQAGYAEVIECGNSYAKVKLKGEAFGGARVGDIFYTALQQDEPVGEVVSASCDHATVRWLHQTSSVGGGDPRNSRAWPKVSGVSRDEGHSRALLVFFAAEPTDDEVRAVHDTLAAAPTAQAAPQPAPATQQAGDVVAYLDVGAGGYLDLGSELSEDALQQLPKGRHALVIAGTYGIDGYVAAPQPAPLSDDVVKDAARYRWLREGNDAKHGAAWHVAVNLYGCEWDAAIDAALAAQGDKA